MLANCLKGHTTKDAPPKVGGTRPITMGADQGRTGYISVVEWLFDRPPGSDINAAAIGKLLWFGHFFEDGWDYLGDLMREWQVLACVVDADPNVNDARRFARKFRGYVWLTRYRRGQTAKEIAIQEEEIIKVRATMAGPATKAHLREVSVLAVRASAEPKATDNQRLEPWLSADGDGDAPEQCRSGRSFIDSLRRAGRAPKLVVAGDPASCGRGCSPRNAERRSAQ